MEINAVALSGELKEIEPLRHTPAGIPLLNFRLAHKSQQMEAGYKRQVDCELNGIAIGEVAVAMSRIQPGSAVNVEGFLNRKNRMSAQLILHVTKAQT
ncbi:MAG TPA: primosomal replication protein N [Burkholderiales bacterium]|nr:primosomal replication protein N [Burkholderiales bacterium]